jgi:hypothetical protein
VARSRPRVFSRRDLRRRPEPMLKSTGDSVNQARSDVSAGGLFALQLGGDREQKLLPLPKGNRRAQLAHQGHFLVGQAERRHVSSSEVAW